MEDIKDIIASLTETRFKQEIEGLRLLERWESIAGKPLAAISRPAFIRKDVLFVFVESGVALQEASYHKEAILKNIRAHKDLPYIREIKLAVRPGPREGPGE